MSDEPKPITLEVDPRVPTLMVQVLPDADGKPTPSITFNNRLSPFSLKITLIRTLLSVLEDLETAEFQGEKAAQAQMAAIMADEGKRRVVEVGRN